MFCKTNSYVSGFEIHFAIYGEAKYPAKQRTTDITNNIHKVAPKTLCAPSLFFFPNLIEDKYDAPAAKSDPIVHKIK